MYKEFNLNEMIKVKLDDRGKDIYYHQYDSWISKTSLKPKYPEVDEEGYTKFQMWDFMKLYADHISMGGKCPFNLNILIDIAEEKDVLPTKKLEETSVGYLWINKHPNGWRIKRYSMIDKILREVIVKDAQEFNEKWAKGFGFRLCD